MKPDVRRWYGKRPSGNLVHVGDEIAQLEQEPQQGQEIEVSPVDLPQRGEKPVPSRRFVIHFPASFLAVRVHRRSFAFTPLFKSRARQAQTGKSDGNPGQFPGWGARCFRHDSSSACRERYNKALPTDFPTPYEHGEHPAP